MPSKGRSVSAEVDEGIADLIQLLWSLEIDTTLSCQEGPNGKTWVYFPSTVDASRFLELLAPDPHLVDDLDDLDNRISGWFEPGDWQDYRFNRAWEYDTSVVDYGLSHPWGAFDDEEECVREDEPCFIFEISVRFPKTDLPAVMDRLKNANA